MKHALAINMESPFMLPGLKLQTTSDARSVVSRLRQFRFEGKKWVLIKE
jgi:hypothetical protein